MTKWENSLQHKKNKTWIQRTEHLQINFKNLSRKNWQKEEGKICYTISNVLRKSYTKSVIEMSQKYF